MNDEAAAPNHYHRLGLERGAEERAIKKAYFGLVRQFPPETHPEEFKQIRAAYETLSDPVARARYDAVDPDYREYGEDVAEAMQAAIQDVKAGKEPEAQARFAHLLQGHPDVVPARELLGLSYLRTGTFDKAKAQFEALIASRPQDFHHHLRAGYAHRGLDHTAPARQCFAKARELAPDELEPVFALASLLSNMGKLDDALAQIADGLSRHKEADAGRLALELKQVELLRRLQRNEAMELLDAVVARTLADPDREFRLYVSSQLTGLATALVLHEDYEGGNAVLARCLRLNPDSIAEHPYPYRARIDVEDLPPASRELLATATIGGNTPAIGRSRWGPCAGAFLLSLAAAAFVTFLVATSGAEPWSRGGLVTAFAFLGAAFAALAFATRWMAAVARSAMPAYTTIHPLYLLEVRPLSLVAWPLVNLRDVRLVRHTTNGAYTHTQVEVRFEDKKFSMSISNEQYAQSWADYLLTTRRHLLELMDQGFMDATPGADLIPRALLLNRKTLRQRVGVRDLRLAAGAVAAAGLVTVGLVPLQRRAADLAKWSSALSANTVAGYQAYKTAYPGSERARQADEQIARRFAAAEAEYRQVAHAQAPARAAMLAALAASRRSADPRMTFVFEGRTAEGPPLDPAMADSFGKRALDSRGMAVRTALQAVFDRAGIGDALRLEPAAGGAAGRLAVIVHVEPQPASFAAPAFTVPAVRLRWDALLVAGTERFQWSASSEPADEMALPLAGNLGPVTACSWQATRAFDELGRDLSVRLGLEAVQADVRAAAQEAGFRAARVSPYR